MTSVANHFRDFTKHVLEIPDKIGNNKYKYQLECWKLFLEGERGNVEGGRKPENNYVKSKNQNENSTVTKYPYLCIYRGDSN